jgi:hypothetical protein
MKEKSAMPAGITGRQLVVAIVGVIAIVLLVPRYLDQITAFGHDIAEPDIATDYLKAVLWAICLGGSILVWPISQDSKCCLMVGWLAKVVVTLGFMLFYENHYGMGGSLDAYMYFDQSNRRAFSLWRFTTAGNDAGTQNIINLASLNNVFVPSSYHAQKVSFAMIGLIAVYLFYRSAVTFLGREDRRLFYLLALFPGILFWSSILGKEPVVLFAIAIYTYGVVHWQLQGKARYFLCIAVGIWIAIFIRVWLGPIMVIPVVVMFLKSSRNVTAKLFLVGASCALLIVSAGPMLERFKIQAFEDVLAAADKTTQGFVTTAGGSTQQLDVDLTSPGGALKFLPQAAFTALFRPLPGEVLNPFGLLAGVESAILLVLLLLAIKRTRLCELSEPLVLWAISFLSIWSLVNGIVSSANFGVGVRYKLQVLPMLLGLLLYLSRKREKAMTGVEMEQHRPLGENRS